MIPLHTFWKQKIFGFNNLQRKITLKKNMLAFIKNTLGVFCYKFMHTKVLNFVSQLFILRLLWKLKKLFL